MDDKRYNNTKEIAGVQVEVSSSIEDYTVTNRIGVVEAIPDWYKGEVKKGFHVVVHHNVFRIYYGMQGGQKSAWNYYKDNIFLLENEQLFLYKDPEKGEWKAPDPFVFLSPVPRLESHDIARIGIEEDHLGVVAYAHPNAPISPGDTVYFRPDMEYEFNIDGQKLYKMNSRNVCLKMSQYVR